MIACLSLYQENYTRLAELTLSGNRMEYCEAHGYLPVFREYPDMDGADIPSIHRELGFKKIEMFLDIFEEHPECDAAWFLDCDAIVTNMLVSQEERMAHWFRQYGYTVILSSDCHGVNAGSMMVRNTGACRQMLKDILALKDAPAYPHEQAAFAAMVRKVAPAWLFVSPQRVMNSYDYALYPDAKPEPDFGKYIAEGQWEKGDFVIHWPGRTLDQRIEHCRQYGKEVIR